MTRSIILLTGAREVPFFEEFLLERNRELQILAAYNAEDLANAVEQTGGNARLISFVTDIIVPRTLLSKLKLTPYNIHPAPPEFPGSHADSFAIWEGADTYGVTAHEMMPSVDSGPIVAVCRFPMPERPERVALSDFAYSKAVEVFAVVAAHCAECDDPMPPVPQEYWSGQKRTRAQFKALCDSLPNWSGEDAQRLKRACGPDLNSVQAG